MKYTLKLFVTGHSPSSERAVQNLRRMVERAISEHEIVIVDVLDSPQIAEDERILATPTLIRESPPPPRRVIGDLSDTAQVLLSLDLQPMFSEREETRNEA